MSKAASPPPAPGTQHSTVRLDAPAQTAALATQPSLGALIGRYELLERVGVGGMGVVYRARDRETQEIVALKVLKPEIAADPTMDERFKNELRLARRITHKNVCRIYDFNRLDGLAYISMEFIEGETLRALLDRVGALPHPHALSVLRQVCAGLREAHVQGVVHRDLKPENIMVSASGFVKLMDFGIARSTDMAATATQTLIGTPAYISPEQANGAHVDPRSDIYSLGLILYECVTGRRAFSGDTPLAVAIKQLQETPPAPRTLKPELPAHIDRAILRCLRKHPDKRFASVNELLKALKRRDHKTRPRRRRWAVLAVIVAVLVGAGLLKKSATAPQTTAQASKDNAATATRAPTAGRPNADEATRARTASPNAALAQPKPTPKAPAAEEAPPRPRIPPLSKVTLEKLAAAARNGDPAAQFRLAQVLLTGARENRNPREGLQWLESAAVGGHQEAQFTLGRLYELGQGRVQRDRDRAVHWYERAADQGHVRARARLRQLRQ